MAVVAATSGRAGRDALGSLAHAYREFAHAHPGTYAAMQRAPEPRYAEPATAARELVDAIAAALSGYGLSGDDAIHAIRVVRASLHGFVSLEQLGGFRIPISLDETFERLVTMLDGSLSEPASPISS